MPRAFHIPAVAFLFCAFALLFLASISLPYLTGLDIVRTTFAGPSSAAEAPQGALKELRVSGLVSYMSAGPCNSVCDKCESAILIGLHPILTM